MSLLGYFKTVSSSDGLPDPRGSLSELMPTRAIEAANKRSGKVKTAQETSSSMAVFLIKTLEPLNN